MTDTAVGGWTDERVDRLRKLWAEGLSASQIATEIGGVSRNAVIGKVHRLGLAGRAKAGPEAGVPKARKPAQVDGAAQAAGGEEAAMVADGAGAAQAAGGGDGAAPPAPRLEEVVVPLSERVTIMELRESMCRWPIGDPTSQEFRFCGGRAITGLPYCSHHAQIAYQPVADRRRDRRVGGRI